MANSRMDLLETYLGEIDPVKHAGGRSEAEIRAEVEKFVRETSEPDVEPYTPEEIDEIVFELACLARPERLFRAAIQAGNYEIRHEAECGCFFEWTITDGQLRDVGGSDYCWTGNILYVDGESVLQDLIGEPLESTGDLDVESILTDMDRYDILEEVTHLDENEESTEHLDREHESLVEWLEGSGYDLYIRYPRNFGNEYDCILAAKGREPEEDWEPQTPEQWASEYLRRPDAMTQVFRGFLLAE